MKLSTLRLLTPFVMVLGTAAVATAIAASKPEPLDLCQEIYPELLQAVKEGRLSKQHAATVLWNCKDNQQRGFY